jgi:hypothetical protein
MDDGNSELVLIEHQLGASQDPQAWTERGALSPSHHP